MFLAQLLEKPLLQHFRRVAWGTRWVSHSSGLSIAAEAIGVTHKLVLDTQRNTQTIRSVVWGRRYALLANSATVRVIADSRVHGDQEPGDRRTFI